MGEVVVVPFEALEIVFVVFELSAVSPDVDFFFGATVSDDVTVLAASGLRLVAVAVSAAEEVVSFTRGISVVAITLTSPLLVSPPLTELLLGAA